MNNHDLDYRLKEIDDSLRNLHEELHQMQQKAGRDEMWDNSDMIRNWKVSSRTLASWRAEKKIRFVQLNNKIWYPKEARSEFIVKYLNKN